MHAGARVCARLLCLMMLLSALLCCSITLRDASGMILDGTNPTDSRAIAAFANAGTSKTQNARFRCVSVSNEQLVALVATRNIQQGQHIIAAHNASTERNAPPATPVQDTHQPTVEQVEERFAVHHSGKPTPQARLSAHTKKQTCAVECKT